MSGSMVAHSLRESVRVPAVGVAQALSAEVVVDLRSPAEFGEDHLPRAKSVPLFDDTERALVGTLYRKESPEAAFAKGRELARQRIRALVDEIGSVCGWTPPEADFENRLDGMTRTGFAGLELELLGVDPPHDAVVLHCWRGGLRSQSVVAFLAALGFARAVVLEGGYRAYRRDVVASLDGLQLPPAVVLRGLTGVGKTLVLRELERVRPGLTIDLEGLAGHRSSILGMVGLEPCSQKAFDSRLLARVRAGLSKVVVFEGESRKVGDVILPERVWSSLAGATNVQLGASPERRVEVLIEDYLATDLRRDQLRGQLPFIERRLGPVRWQGALVAMLDEGREDELVRTLLERYYDPLYTHSERDKTYALTLDATDPARAARELADWIDARAP